MTRRQKARCKVSEWELAREAYSRQAAQMAGEPAWDALSDAHREEWYNRVGGYLSMPWEAADDQDSMDRWVREACVEFGGLG